MPSSLSAEAAEPIGAGPEARTPPRQEHTIDAVRDTVIHGLYKNSFRRSESHCPANLEAGPEVELKVLDAITLFGIDRLPYAEHQCAERRQPSR